MNTMAEESQNQGEIANRITKLPNPMAPPMITHPVRSKLARRAAVKRPTMEPMPANVIRVPMPSAPTSSTSTANTGMKSRYDIPKIAMNTLKLTKYKNMECFLMNFIPSSISRNTLPFALSAGAR